MIKIRMKYEEFVNYVCKGETDIAFNKYLPYIYKFMVVNNLSLSTDEIFNRFVLVKENTINFEVLSSSIDAEKVHIETGEDGIRTALFYYNS